MAQQAIKIDVTYLQTSQGCPDVDELRQLIARAKAGEHQKAAKLTGKDRRTIAASWDRFMPALIRGLEQLEKDLEAQVLER